MKYYSRVLSVSVAFLFSLTVTGHAQLLSQTKDVKGSATASKPFKMVTFKETTKMDAMNVVQQYIKDSQDVINVDIPGSPNEKSMEFISFEDEVIEKGESYRIMGNFKDPETRKTVQVILVAKIKGGQLTVAEKLYQTPIEETRPEPVQEIKLPAKGDNKPVKKEAPLKKSNAKKVVEDIEPLKAVGESKKEGKAKVKDKIDRMPKDLDNEESIDAKENAANDIEVMTDDFKTDGQGMLETAEEVQQMGDADKDEALNDQTPDQDKGNMGKF